MRLAGKIALVTGGNSGIGLGIARRLHSEGATGVIVGRSSDTLESARRVLRDDFSAIQCDVTIVEELRAMFLKAHNLVGNLDVLVVNAGGGVGPGSIQPFDQVTEKSFGAMADLNLKSVFFTVKEALPYLDEGASIVLVASIAGQKAFPGMSVYAACKAGVRSLARSLSAELMPRGIRVNVLSPGTVETPVFERLGFSESEIAEMKSQFASLIPLRRTGSPEEMGAVAAFLASPDSSFVIGEEIVADGGVVNL